MKVYSSKFRFFIWDEELRIVVSQLEKNLSILKVLYPVVMAVSALIAAGMCFLLILQKTREAAILRVLGTTRTVVRLALTLNLFPFHLSAWSSVWDWLPFCGSHQERFPWFPC